MHLIRWKGFLAFGSSPLAFGSWLLAFLIRVVRIDGRRLSPKERKFICNVLFRT
jgi:hypothetical protein